MGKSKATSPNSGASLTAADGEIARLQQSLGDFKKSLQERLESLTSRVESLEGLFDNPAGASVAKLESDMSETRCSLAGEILDRITKLEFAAHCKVSGDPTAIAKVNHLEALFDVKYENLMAELKEITAQNHRSSFAEYEIVDDDDFQDCVQPTLCDAAFETLLMQAAEIESIKASNHYKNLILCEKMDAQLERDLDNDKRRQEELDNLLEIQRKTILDVVSPEIQKLREMNQLLVAEMRSLKPGSLSSLCSHALDSDTSSVRSLAQTTKRKGKR